VKRILFLVSSMHGGGAERVAALLSNHWVEQGHEVILMPTFSGRGDCVYPLDERVRLVFLADRVGNRSHSMLNKLRRLKELRCVIRQLAPDLVVSFLPHVNVAAILAAWGSGVPVVVSERTYPPSMPLGFVLESARKWTYPQARAVVIQTEQARDWLSRCCPRACARVIANPVVYPLPQGEPAVDPMAIVARDRRVVLGVGRLADEKGFSQLIDAFQKIAMRHTEWDLVILGEGPERNTLENQRAKLGLNGRVFLPGRAGNMSEWYERAELYVMSSRFEGFPNALAEAMAHGLPAVSFDCLAGPRDIIREGLDGCLVAPYAGPSGLSDAMEGLMQHDSQRQGMAEAAKAVRSRFSLEYISAQWDQVLGLMASGNV
jgi:GalNAc-alpha-(1->4)-GalNAc-alpha-(1->3)-diNAcBac-PP-undecaprenol alpha-1,4-N-acetyl-D-galactosaminyltransferase